MTRLRLLINAFQLATPVFAAWALCEVALYASIDLLVTGGLK